MTAQAGSQQRFVRMFDAAPLAMVLTRLADEVVLNANPAAAMLFGYSVDDFIGRTSDQLRTWIDPAQRARYFADVRAGRAVRRLDAAMRRQDGSELMLEIYGEPIRLDGEPCALTMFIDITPQLAYLRQIQHQYDLLGAVFEAIGDALILTDAADRILLANPAAERVFGRAPESLLGRSAGLLFAEDEALGGPFSVADASAALSGGRVLFGRRASGERFPAEVGISRVAADEGAPAGWAVLVRDISERQRRQRQLTEHQARLQDLIDTMADWFWECDAEARFTFVSERVREVLGYEPAELIGTTAFALMPPDEAERIQPAFAAIVAAAEPFRDLENVNLTKTGAQRIMATSAAPIRAVDGAVAGWRGIDRDITESRRAAERLRESEALHRAVFEHTAEGILLTDPDNRIVAVNPAFTAITGYSEQEALGQLPSVLQSGRQERGFYRALWRELSTTGSWQGEIWNRRKDGEIYPEWLSISEIRDVDGALKYRVGVFSDITRMRRSEEEIDQLTHYDPITGLPNLTSLRVRLTQALQSSQAANRPLALILLNLDGFNRIVASFGHEAADAVLAAAGQKLKRRLPAGETLARIVGDTFAVTYMLPLPDASPSRQAVALQDALRDEIAVLGTGPLTLTCCIGVALYPSDAETAQELLQDADAALQRAKAEGAGSIAYYRPALTAVARERIDLERRLRAALAAGEFELYFQPKLDTVCRCIVGAEALIRWRRPDGTMVPPGEFMPVVEDSDLMLDVDRWVLRAAAEALLGWHRAGLRRTRLSVNISAAMLTGGNLAAEIEGVLAATGLDPTLLEIEVLENILIQDPDHAEAELTAVGELGIGIALDDFGTGYASLGYLKRFAFDYLKIDRSFIAGLTPESEDMAIVRATILMAHHLGIRVVAEGVEDDAQIRQLASLGCDLLQGYRIGRPMSGADFERLLGGDSDALTDDLRAALVRRVLLVGVCTQQQGSLGRELTQLGWSVVRAASAAEALTLLAQQQFDLMLCDDVLSDGDAVTLLADARSRHPGVPRLLLVGELDPAVLMDALNRGGIHRCLPKPCSSSELAAAVQAGYEHGLRRLRAQIQQDVLLG